jgi:hypothetical protein
VVQAGAVVGVADIHAGTLADSIQSFENLDRIRAVVGGVRVAGGSGQDEIFPFDSKLNFNADFISYEVA